MNSILKKLITILIAVFFITDLHSQDILQIFDKDTRKPIAGVSFTYENQKGQSDKEGKISLKIVEKGVLEITHIGYAMLLISHSELQTVLQRGWVELQPANEILLSPVSVYALKGKAAKENMKLSNGEWIQHDAGQVLQQIPGFSAMRKSGDFGFDPVFRGFKLDQLNIVTNGGLTNLAACPNRMDPPTSQVLVSQVERVEVFKGPHNFRYGPATGAVINFKTQEPEFTHQPKPFGRINGGYETNGAILRTEGVMGIRTNNMQLAATGSYSKGHDYKDGNDSIIPARFGRGSIGIQTDFKIKQKNLLSIAATRSFASKVDFPTLPMDLITDNSWMIQGEYKSKNISKKITEWNTQLYTSFVDHLMGNNYRPEAGKSADAETAVNTKTIGMRTEMVLKTQLSELIFGLDTKHEEEDGNRVRSNIRMGPMKGKTIIDTVWQDSRITRGGAFAEWHYQLQQYRLATSGRLDVVQGTAENPSSKFKALYANMQATDVNPSMSIGISRQWAGNWHTGLWLGRGVRSASIPERFINSLQIGIDPYEMLGNPQLKPEANHQADLIFGYKTQKTSVQWNGFASMVTNYISAVKTTIPPRFGAPGVRQYINLDKALLYGFEFSWMQQWLPELMQQFTAAYTYGKNNDNGEPLPQIAPFDLRYSLEARLWNNSLLPYAQIRWVAKQGRVATDFGEAATPEFTNVNIGVKSEPVKNLQLTASVNNVFNRAYREHLSRFIRPTLPLNNLGRSLVIMASYSF